MSGKDIPASFADEESIRGHLPSLENGELLKVTYDKTAPVEDFGRDEEKKQKSVTFRKKNFGPGCKKTAQPKGPSIHRIVDIINTVAKQNVVRNFGRVEENLDKLVEVTTREKRPLKKGALEENESGSRSKKIGCPGRSSRIHGILGPTNTFANKNVGEDFGRDEEKNQKNVTTWEKIFGPGPKTTVQPKGPSIHRILDIINTVAKENVGRVEENPEKLVGVTALEKRPLKRKGTRFVKKATKNIPVSYEYLAGLAVQNGAQIVPQVYDFVLVHAPLVAKALYGNETWRNSIRESLAGCRRFFTEKLLSFPFEQELNGYSMSPHQVFLFRKKFPFSYDFFFCWLREPADFEAIYYGKKGFPSQEEVKRAYKIYNIKKEEVERPTTHEGGKTTGNIATILDEYETEVDSDCVVEGEKRLAICQTTHSSSGHLAEVPSVTAASSVEERLFLSSVTSPSGVDFAAYFDSPQKIAPSSLPPIHSNSTTPFEQTTYGGLSNLDPIPPKQLSSMDNDYADTPISFPPIWIPHYACNEIPMENSHQMRGVDPAIAPEQTAEITRGSYELMNSRRIYANQHVNLWKTHPEPFMETTNAPVIIMKRKLTVKEVYEELERKRLRDRAEQNELDAPSAPEKSLPPILQTEGTQPQQALGDWFSNFDCEEQI